LSVRTGGRFAFSHASIPMDPLATALGLPAKRIADASFGFGGGLSLTFIPHKSLRLVTALQHAFRAPNLDDYSAVGSEGAGFDVPSPNLSPEQATSLEAGVKWAWKRVGLSLFGHYTILHDFIARRFTGTQVDGEPAMQRVNMGRGFVTGLEADLKIGLPKHLYLAAWISYTYGDIRMPLQDPMWQPIRRMSPLQGLAAAGYRRRRYWAQVSLRWSARQDRLSPGDLADGRICPNGPDDCKGTPGFAVVSVAAGVQLNRYVDVTIRVENLSNEPYKYHGSGVYAPGLSAVALLRIRK
jgi:outer membrane receptor protein involved in Fe transport